MTVLFATLGFTPQSVIASIRWVPDLEKVVLFHSRHGKSRDARDSVRKACDAIGIEVESWEVADEYSLIPLMKQMNDKVDEYRSSNLIFNVTGGTKMLASAALLLCVFRGMKTIYVRESDGAVIEVPIMRINYSELLSKKEKSVLKTILDICGNKDMVELSKVYRSIKNTKSVTALYLDELEKKGLIERVNDPENGRKKWLIIKEAARVYQMQEGK